ncbi:MAG: hypothetical protein ACTS73_06335 [Arsenophonus sp. NEOnobi-MAG3]
MVSGKANSHRARHLKLSLKAYYDNMLKRRLVDKRVMLSHRP